MSKDPEARLWTRLRNIAAAENKSFEEMAELTDRDLWRCPNMGAMSLRLFRTHYPQPQPAPALTGKAGVIKLLTQAQAAIAMALQALEAEDAE